MERPQISLTTVLLLGAGLPIWLFLIIVLAGSQIGPLMGPFVLVGITLAIHRLVRRRQDAWGLSILLAGIIALGSLRIVAWWAEHG